MESATTRSGARFPVVRTLMARMVPPFSRRVGDGCSHSASSMTITTFIKPFQRTPVMPHSTPTDNHTGQRPQQSSSMPLTEQTPASMLQL